MGPHINLKEAGESIDFLCTGSREHEVILPASGQDPSRQSARAQQNHELCKSVVPGSASAICPSQDKVPAFVCLHLLSLRARNCINPCLLGHCIKKGMYEISWLLSHNPLSPSSSRTLSLIGEQGLWEILCQRHRVQWPSHLKKATEVSTPLPP